MTKKTALAALLAALILLAGTALADVTAHSVGEMEKIACEPRQRLAFRTGPGTKYTDIFSLDPKRIWSLSIYQMEAGGTVDWGMIEFKCYRGLYRAYTGMHYLEVEGDVEYGNQDPVRCYIGDTPVECFAGPGEEYVKYYFMVPEWTDLQVYHEENGYVMADFVMPDAKPQPFDAAQQMITRAWIHIYDLEGYASGEAQAE